MTVASAAVTVTTTATALNTVDTGRATGEQSIEVHNASAVDVFWGGADVTTATGVPIAAGSSRAFDLAAGEVVYGIVAAATADVRVGRVGVG